MKRGQITINVDDIIGKRLGKLEVVRYAHNQYADTKGGKRMRHFYVCECDCGVVKFIQRGPLMNNIVHSCGCGRKFQSWQK